VKTFKERLEAACDEQHEKEPWNDDYYAFMAGARAALEMAAADGEEFRREIELVTGKFDDNGARVDCGWLRARAKELSDG